MKHISVFNGRTWLVATLLDSTDLYSISIITEKPIKQHGSRMYPHEWWGLFLEDDSFLNAIVWAVLILSS